MLANLGADAFLKRAVEDPRALTETLQLSKLVLETGSPVKYGAGYLRIRDSTTGEVCLYWEPKRSKDRPPTDPSQAPPENDKLTRSLHDGGDKVSARSTPRKPGSSSTSSTPR